MVWESCPEYAKARSPSLQALLWHPASCTRTLYRHGNLLSHALVRLLVAVTDLISSTCPNNRTEVPAASDVAELKAGSTNGQTGVPQHHVADKPAENAAPCSHRLFRCIPIVGNQKGSSSNIAAHNYGVFSVATSTLVVASIWVSFWKGVVLADKN